MIFVSSSSGVAALEEYVGYGASKAALNHLARILPFSWGPTTSG
jgi:NAD(P)-dependent dehydrogenase (short-subunit alcohol dehydrogenase family)